VKGRYTPRVAQHASADGGSDRTKTGSPVEGAAISVHLPEEGPGGVFANGMRTEVRSRTAMDMPACMACSGTALPDLSRFESWRQEQARAGMVSLQYIAEPGSRAAAATAGSSHGYRTWMVLAVLAGGGRRRESWPRESPGAPRRRRLRQFRPQRSRR